MGIVIRIYYEYFLFEPFFSIPLPRLFSVPFMENAELMILLTIFLAVISLLLLLFGARHWIITEYAVISAARIRCSKVTRDELREAFPDVFPDTSND